MLKTCNVCGVTKDITEFYANKSYRDGCEGKCKACRKAYQVSWRADNRQMHRDSVHEYYRTHKEEKQKYYKKWCAENSEHKAFYDRNWKHSNPERYRAQCRSDFAKRRARIVGASGKFTQSEWRMLKTRYGNRCLKCGRSEPDVKITPDHVIPLALGGNNDIGNIQPLCIGCNAAKQARIIDYRETTNQLSATTRETA